MSRFLMMTALQAERSLVCRQPSCGLIVRSRAGCVLASVRRAARTARWLSRRCFQARGADRCRRRNPRIGRHSGKRTRSRACVSPCGYRSTHHSCDHLCAIEHSAPDRAARAGDGARADPATRSCNRLQSIQPAAKPNGNDGRMARILLGVQCSGDRERAEASTDFIR